MYMLVYPGEIQTLNLLMVLEKGEEKGSQRRGEGRKRGGRGGKTGRRRQGEPASPPPPLSSSFIYLNSLQLVDT